MKICDKCGKKDGIRTRIERYIIYVGSYNRTINLANKELCRSCWREQQRLLESVL